jgi:hypothetical protein
VTERIQRAADLRAAGYDKNEVRRMVRAGVLARLCRGAYITSEPNDVCARHRLLVRAVLAELALGAVASHVSAAVLHGLPTWGLRLDRVHVTFARRSGGRRDERLYVHTAPLEPDEIVVIDGVLVTTAARALVDIARTVGFEPAVAVADAALRLDTVRRRHGSSTVLPRWPESGALPWPGAAGRAELDAALRRATGWPGVPAARRVVAFPTVGRRAWGSHAAASRSRGPGSRPPSSSGRCHSRDTRRTRTSGGRSNALPVSSTAGSSTSAC